MNKKTELIILCFVVLISRLPFLLPGYGTEEDSWGIALSAYHTLSAGSYEYSRLPGHPVQEFVITWLWQGGPFISNLLSALFGTVATLFFALSLKKLNFNHYLIAAYAFAFTPIVYISSTYTIDYMWAMAFVLIALYLLLSNNYILAGMFIGLAAGCRITSLAFLLPFAAYVFINASQKKESITHLFKLGVSATIIAFICFIPVIKIAGWGFFNYYDQFPYPPVAKVFYKGTLGVFGTIGLITISVCKVIQLAKTGFKIHRNIPDLKNSKALLWLCYTAIAVFIIAYLRLPQKSGYLIPIIPFGILFFGLTVSEKLFKVICISLIVSSFCFSVNLTDPLRGAAYSKMAVKATIAGQQIFIDPLNGPIFSELSKRKQKEKYVAEVLLKCDSIKKPTVVIAGWWYNQLSVEQITKPKNDAVVFEGYIPGSKMNDYKNKGYSIYFLPEQALVNDQMYKQNTTNKLATPF